MPAAMKFETRIAPLDLDITLGCGQTFRWRRREDGAWQGVLGDQLVSLAMGAYGLVVDSSPGRHDVEAMVREYLRAEDDIAKIQRRLGRDAVLARGMREVKGLRIVKMDEWECLVSYLLATYANIPRIARMIESVSSTWGAQIADRVHEFPSRDDLSGASESELKRCGLGYRARYVRELCDAVDMSSMRRFRRLGYEDLREALKELPGVGDKVADCVCLFGFGRLEAFPIDVWMERALARLYKAKGSYRKLRMFALEKFGPFAGYAQEYLYYNERLRAPDGTCVFSHK